MQNMSEIINKAINLQKTGKLKEAEEYLQLHYDNSKDDRNISIAYASISENIGNKDVAIKILKEAILLNPDDGLLHTNLGGVLVRNGKSREAISYLEKASSLIPNNIINYTNLACAYAEEKDWKRAAASAEVVLSQDPYSTFMLKLIAQSSIEIKNYSRCLSAYDKLSDLQNIKYQYIRNSLSSININYSREKPSDRYYELSNQYEIMHKKSVKEKNLTFAGIVTFLRVAPFIKKSFRNKNISSMLDYGGGQGKQYILENLHDSNGIKYQNMKNFLDINSVKIYDAGRPDTFENLGKTYDAVICTDVLEHCDKLDLPWIISELFEHTKKYLFATIATYPAVKMLPNGENAHCTIENSKWWSDLFSKIAYNFPDIEYSFLVVNDKSFDNVEAFTNSDLKV